MIFIFFIFIFFSFQCSPFITSFRSSGHRLTCVAAATYKPTVAVPGLFRNHNDKRNVIPAVSLVLCGQDIVVRIVPYQMGFSETVNNL